VDLDMKNKVVVIMGGTSGIGLKTAELLLQEGAKVAICGRSEERLAQAMETLNAFSDASNIFGMTCDVASRKDVEAFIDATGNHYEKIDVLLNNAGKSIMSHFFDITDEQWQEQINLKYFAVIFAVQAVVPFMRKQGAGRIININATLSKEPEPHMIATAATRAGLLNLTKGLSHELAKDNILVNTVSLGLIKTDQWERRRLAQTPDQDPDIYYKELAMARNIPLSRVGLPEEVANVILFLASERSSYVTGANIEVSGGLSKVL
jgi:NAD(P)-dependent dehydrogenase (short-subunit alcohol dehydrogenase family)